NLQLTFMLISLPAVLKKIIVIIFLTSLLGFASNATAGGIRGFVKDEKGEPLAFATIFVKQTGSGTTTNINGEYELQLPSGNYEIVYQFVGYESVVKQFVITPEFL